MRKKDMQAKIDELENMLHTADNDRSRLKHDVRGWIRDYYGVVSALRRRRRTIVNQKAQIIELATENGRLTDQLAQEKAAFDVFLAKVSDAAREAFDYIDAATADECDCDPEGPVTYVGTVQ